ncbi:hypothetical protein D3C87_2100240 [compost metagenome]
MKEVAMPINAITHIQKMAPGPPAVSAIATPVRLLVPTRAAREVHSAWKDEIPTPSLLVLFFSTENIWLK